MFFKCLFDWLLQLGWSITKVFKFHVFFHSGYFMIIRNGTGSRSKYSYLLSPQLSATAPSCKMQVFYYGSKNSNWLRVSHKQSDSNGKSILSRLLSTRITNMDKWQNVTIGLGQRPEGNLSFPGNFLSFLSFFKNFF